MVGYHGKSVVSLAGVLNGEGAVDHFPGFARSLVDFHVNGCTGFDGFHGEIETVADGTVRG